MCVCDGNSPIHARRLLRAGIELVSSDNLHALLETVRRAVESTSRLPSKASTAAQRHGMEANDS